MNRCIITNGIYSYGIYKRVEIKVLSDNKGPAVSVQIACVEQG